MDNFVNRLSFILKNYELSASSLADKIGVQRSSLSHLLSGRNKPSLDFVLKLHQHFPEIDLYWLLKGEGAPEKSIQKTSESEEKVPITPKESTTDPTVNPAPLSKQSSPQHIPNTREEVKQIAIPSNVEKIVLFYTDGTFKIYTPSNGSSE